MQCPHVPDVENRACDRCSRRTVRECRGIIHSEEAALGHWEGWGHILLCVCEVIMFTIFTVRKRPSTAQDVTY